MKQGTAALYRARSCSRITQEGLVTPLPASFLRREDTLMAEVPTHISPLNAETLLSLKEILTGTNELLSSSRRAKPRRKQSGSRHNCTPCFSSHHKSQSGLPSFQCGLQHQLYETGNKKAFANLVRTENGS